MVASVSYFTPTCFIQHIEYFQIFGIPCINFQFMFFTTIATIASAVAVASATEDSCVSLCNQIDGCKTAKYGSYCKAWKEPAVCFGLVRKADGSYCFQPNDKDCFGYAVSCDTSVTTPVAPVTSTTVAPVTSTTVAPVTSTTAAPVTSTTAAPVTSTTAAPVTSTTVAPVTSTTVAPVTSTTVAPVTSTTVAPVTSTTVAPVTSTTAAPVTSTTAAPVTSTTAAPVTSTTAAPVTSTTVAPVTSTTVAPVTTTTTEAPVTTTEAASRLVVSFMTIQRSPVHPTPGISPSSKAPGSPSDKRTKEGIKDLHEELQQKLRSVDLEAQGAYKEVNRILSDSIVEGRYYKGSVSFMRECIIHLAELFGTKCEELAAERLLRIAAMEELSALKAAAERSEGEKEGRKRKRVKAKDARLQGPGDPVSPSHMDIDGVDTASVDTESVDTASVVTEGDGRALALPAPGPPGQRRIISRPQQRAKAGWVEVARRPPKPRKSPSEALQAQPREKRHLVLHVAIKVTEAGEGKPWPEASELDIQICRTKLGEAVAVHTDWKIVNTWKVRYGLAMEVADQKTFDDIVKIPPKDLVVRDLPGKRTELIIEGIPEEVGEEGTLRRELQLRNGITAGYEVIKISKKKGGNNAILRMDPEAARVLLEKGANRIPIYVGYSRVRVKPHVFTRVCFTCGLRHKAGEECTAAASCAWCGEEGHQMRECERLPSDPGRKCLHCKKTGHGSVEYRKCDAVNGLLSTQTGHRGKPTRPQ